MIIAFDYFHTINEFPEMMAGLSQWFRDQGHGVVIISAIGKEHDEDKYYEKLVEEMEEIGFVYDKIHLVLFGSPIEIPDLKLGIAQKIGVNLFIDDRKDVVDKFNAFGIKGIWAKRFLTKK